MAQEKRKDDCSGRDNNQNNAQASKQKLKKDKNFQTKIIIRRLPPTMTEEQFLDLISPIPDHDYMYFVKGDMQLGQHAFSRAYINFINQDDIFIFKDSFDGYVFLDSKGNEYPAIVEFAPFQKIPKKRSKRRDAKSGTIDQDPDYLKFLEGLQGGNTEASLPTAEVYLEELETREKELKANNGVPKVTTPLIEYLKQRKIEQQKLREEKREERKRRELEKKRLREEERRKRKAEKERERVKEKPKDRETPIEKEPVEIADDEAVEDMKQSDSAILKVLKNPEREKEKEQKSQPLPQKIKELPSTSLRMTKDRERGSGRREWERERDRQREQRERLRARERDHLRDRDRPLRDRDHIKRNGHRSSTSNASSGCESESVKHSEDDGRKTKEYRVSFEEAGSKCSKEKAKFYPDKSEHSFDRTTVISRWRKHDKRTNEYSSEVPASNDFQASEVPYDIEKSSFSEPSAVKSSADFGSKENTEAVITDDDSGKGDSSYSESRDGKDHSKDPRVERRIRNKDRPSLEIYRPGMRRLSTQRNSPQKEVSTSASNSSSPSPTPVTSKKFNSGDASKDGDQQQDDIKQDLEDEKESEYESKAPENNNEDEVD